MVESNNDDHFQKEQSDDDKQKNKESDLLDASLAPLNGLDYYMNTIISFQDEGNEEKKKREMILRILRD